MRVSLCKKTRTIKQLLRPGANSGAIVKFDGEGDEIEGEGTDIDGVGLGVAVAVVGQEVLDILLSGGGCVELAVLLQCEKDADSGEIDCGGVTGDGSGVLSRLYLTS